MNKDDLLTRVKNQLRTCAGWESDQDAADRAQALNYYFMRPRGDEIAGRSQVVSGDVSSMVEASLAQMLDAYSSDNIVEFDPVGPEDEDQAQLETDAVTHFVMKESNGFLELAQAIKDALLLRNGVVKVWCEDFEETRTRTFVDVSPEAYAELSADVDVLSYKDGELKVRETTKRKRFQSRRIAIENFLYDSSHDSLDVQSIAICGERRHNTRSELKLMGFPKAKVDACKHTTTDHKVDSAARNPRRRTDNTRPVDTAGEVVEWYETYVLVDADEDGISERHRVCLTDDVLLSDEDVTLVPYGAGAVLLNPGKFRGISQYDKLKQTQDERTALKRARCDNINTTTKNRLAYLDGKVNPDDVADGRPNGAIRVKSNVADIRAAVMPFTVPDTSGPISAAIQETKSERTELGGAALELATGQMQIGGDRMGSQGLDRAYSVMEQLSAMMTKNVAATLIRSTFLLAHATLREHYTDPVPIKRNGKWFSPIPSEWPERTRLTVKIGMSPGERMRRVAALDKSLANQVQLASLGMDEVLVNLRGFYKTMMDRDRAADLQNPEQYYVDPESEEAQKALAAKAKASAEQQAQQKALMQQAIGLEQIRSSIDKYKVDVETQFKYWAETLRAEIAEAQIVGKATVDLIAAKEKPDDRKGTGEAPGGESAAAEAA